MRLFISLGCAWALLLSAGCRTGAVVPDGWTAEATAASTAEAWQAEAQAQRDEEPRLQVFIHYSRTHSTHVAVRVTSPDTLAVFWDPGGAYGRTKPAYGRQNDIILDAPPDLPTWWTYRQRWLREPLLYVFEWDVAATHAVTLRDALLDGAAHGREAETFQTVRRPGMCVIAVCEFLRTFGPPRISPKLHTNILPNTLAHQLWRQQPDRVLRYEGPADATPMVLMPIDLSDEALAEQPSEDTDNGVDAAREASEARRSSRDDVPGS